MKVCLCKDTDSESITTYGDLPRWRFICVACAGLRTLVEHPDD